MSCASSCETGYPSSARTTRGVTTKIDATAANESWKPASKSAYGFQPRSTAAPTSSACHRSRSRPASQASEPRRGGERSAHDGWMEPDRERIRRHRGQRRELGDVDPEAEEQDDGGSATTDRGDLQPVDGEAVVEARGPEVGEQALVDAGGPPEDDRLDHVARARRPGPASCRRSASARRDRRRRRLRRAARRPETTGARRTAWMPCRRSHFASSKPFDGPGGAFSSPSSLSRAPCGGERPSGSWSRTGSWTRSVPQRSTSAFIRWSKLPARGGSSTSTIAHSAVSIRVASTLWSS